MSRRPSGDHSDRRRPLLSRLGGWARAAIAAAASAAVLALLLPSCGVFDTRDSEPPESETPCPRQEPVNADAVIFNFTNAVQCFSQANYEESLGDAFVFMPDEEDRAYFLSQAGNDIFEGWGKEDESTAVRKIFSESDTLTVAFTEEYRTSGVDDVTIRMDYVFRRVILRQEAADSVAVFKGLVDIYLVRDQSNVWSIESWTEFSKQQKDQTWGFLKGKVTIG